MRIIAPMRISTRSEVKAKFTEIRISWGVYTRLEIRISATPDVEIRIQVLV